MTVIGDDGTEDLHSIERERPLPAREGDEVTAGDARWSRAPRPQERSRDQGRPRRAAVPGRRGPAGHKTRASIHDKHIELIVRQMTRRIAVQEPGESDFLPGERPTSGCSPTPTASQLVTEVAAGRPGPHPS